MERQIRQETLHEKWSVWLLQHIDMGGAKNSTAAGQQLASLFRAGMLCMFYTTDCVDISGYYKVVFFLFVFKLRLIWATCCTASIATW